MKDPFMSEGGQYVLESLDDVHFTSDIMPESLEGVHFLTDLTEDPLALQTTAFDAFAVHSPPLDARVNSPLVADQISQHIGEVPGETASLIATEPDEFLFERLYFCTINGCYQTFFNSKKYQEHRVKIHNLPRYECNTCQAAFSSYHKLVSHMEDEMHFISCQFCNTLCASPSLSASLFSLYHKICVCVFCKTKFYGKIAYKKHERECMESTLSPVMNAVPSDQFVHEEATQLEMPAAAVNIEDNVNGLNSLAPDINASETDSVPETRNTEAKEVEENGDYDDNECTVIFGPGAQELLESPESSIPSCSRPEQQVLQYKFEQTQDIHSVHSSPQENSTKFRYLCKYCSSKFSSKIMLKRHHQKKHNFACHCGEIFVRRFDLIKHKRIHRQVAKIFFCSTCNLKVQDFQQLLLHEMRHRLKSNYKHKIEKEAGKGRSKCCKCNKEFSKTSTLIRHEVWHEWERIWNSYVTMKVFRYKITEEEIRSMEDGVKNELAIKWKKLLGDTFAADEAQDLRGVRTADDKTEVISTDDVAVFQEETNTGSLPTDEAQDVRGERTAGDKNEIISTDDVAIFQEETNTERLPTQSQESQESKHERTKRNKTSSGSSNEDTEDNMKLLEWMSYWRSYIGLNDTDPEPSWLQPILDIISSKFKYFDINYQEDLYRKMDQVAFLVRAQRGEENLFGGARVVLEKLSPFHVPSQRKRKVHEAETSLSDIISEVESSRPSTSHTTQVFDCQSLQPVVLLNRYILPHMQVNLDKCVQKPSKLLEAVENWLKTQSAASPVPRWALKLVNDISSTSLITNDQIKFKLGQISELIEAEHSKKPPKETLPKVWLRKY